jgi:hypothetical protein
MNTPLEGLKVKIQKPGYQANYTNTSNDIVEVINPNREITNYEYEVRKNEEKRKILIIKKEYLSVIITEFKNLMRYDNKVTNYIDEKTKKVLSQSNK